MGVDAGRETLFDERLRETVGARIGRHGRQYENAVVHRPCTLAEVGVLFLRVPKKIEARTAAKRKAASVKRPSRNRRIVQLLILFVASIIIVDGLVGERGLLAMLRAHHEYDELAASVARQRAENARLRDQARRLREDPSAIEEIARRELGLIKPGERVFIVKDVPPSKTPR